MLSRTRRGRFAPRIEALESRALLSGDAARGLFVGFTPNAPVRTVEALLAQLRPQSVEAFPSGSTYVVPGEGIDAAAAARRLVRNPAVRYVEADTRIEAQALIPNDPRIGEQWGLISSAGIDIRAAEAWQITTGNPGTVVAVIDSGVDFSHPDLVGRAWVNPGEAGGRPGRDDDRNGYVDDLHGWNFLNSNHDLSDRADHGTHIAAILAGTGNNGQGVAGVDWNARIMALKFLDAGGGGDISQAVRAIYYAVDKGARVINASWGTPDYSRALADAISYANGRNVVFVTAAGNESADNDRVPSYPALINLPNVISVAAIDQAGNLARYSNYGRSTVHIAAPGSSIVSALPGGRYASFSGTSMASPFVAGVAALLVGQNPQWTAGQIVQRILATARPLPGLQGRVISGGMLDAAAALADGPAPPLPNPGSGSGSNPPWGLPVNQTGWPGGAAFGDTIRTEILASAESYAVRGGADAPFVDSLYRDLLGRSADAGGLAYWTTRLAQGAGRQEVVAAILGSHEGRRTKIARWMLADLGWTAPLEEIKALPHVGEWADRLAQGVGDSAIRVIILGSEEYFVRSGGPAGWVDALYRVSLNRPAEPEGVAEWTRQLAAGRSRHEIALGILTSTEARRTKAAGWYQTDLRRPNSLDELKGDPGVIQFADRIAD